MTRLPTVGGDTDAWGTVLNDYLNVNTARAALSANTVVTDTSITVSNVPPGVLAGAALAIDAYTTQCETKTVASVSGNTITLTDGLRFSHSSGDAIVPIKVRADIALYGIKGDATNEWSPLQRFALECGLRNLILEGLGARVDIAQPLVFSTSTYTNRVWVRTHSTYGPVTNPNGGVVTVAMRNSTFTATASDNKFTTPAAHGMSVGQLIVFGAPYGETLPGGIVPGFFYFVKTVPTGTTFTISETSGGAEFDVTSDGAGYDWSSLGGNTLTRLFAESLRIDLNVADVNGLVVSLQQPSWTRNTRIECLVNCTTEKYGAIVAGQQSYHENWEINTAANMVGLSLSGTGHIFRGINDNGDPNSTVVRVTGDSNHISDVWQEQCLTGVEVSGTCRGLSLTGTLHHNPNTTSGRAILVTANTTSYLMDMMIHSTTASNRILEDTARSITLTGEDISDGGNVPLTWGQPYGPTPPVFNNRLSAFGTGDVQVRYGHGFLAANPTAAERTMTLPTAAGWAGWWITIASYPTSGSNATIVATTSGQTIDGAATVSLAANESVTVISDGSNWKIIDRKLPGSIQTYTPTNVSTDRTYDANATTIDEIADVLGTLIADLQSRKVIS